MYKGIEICFYEPVSSVYFDNQIKLIKVTAHQTTHIIIAYMKALKNCLHLLSSSSA